VKLLVQTTRRDPASGTLTAEDLQLMEQEIRRIEIRCDFSRFARHRNSNGLLACCRVAQEALQLIRGRAEQKQVSIQTIVPSVR